MAALPQIKKEQGQKEEDEEEEEKFFSEEMFLLEGEMSLRRIRLCFSKSLNHTKLYLKYISWNGQEAQSASAEWINKMRIMCAYVCMYVRR